jgi:hypothetical protein
MILLGGQVDQHLRKRQVHKSAYGQARPAHRLRHPSTLLGRFTPEEMPHVLPVAVPPDGGNSPSVLPVTQGIDRLVTALQWGDNRQIKRRQGRAARWAIMCGYPLNEMRRRKKADAAACQGKRRGGKGWNSRG